MSNFRDDTLWIVIAGFLVCFLMAMAMGANDVANAFGTSVGAGVITLKQAFCIAAACNFLGALLMSRAVTETIRKGIVDLQGFDDEPEELMLLMLCGMIGSVCYVAGATALRLPVSTTQAILGGLVGASIVRNGNANGVRWADKPVCAYSAKTGRFSCGGIAGVVLQWFFAPLIAMALAVLCFELSRRVLLNASKENALWRAPAFMAILNGLVFFALAWFIVVGAGVRTPPDRACATARTKGSRLPRRSRTSTTPTAGAGSRATRTPPSTRPRPWRSSRASSSAAPWRSSRSAPSTSSRTR